MKRGKNAAETMAEFMTASVFKNGLMNTDTHAGNFIFCPGGRVAFIDFGRVFQVEAKGVGELLKAVIRRDANAAKHLLPILFPMKEKATHAPYPFDEIWPFFLSQQSHLHTGEFCFTREYIARTMMEGKRFPYRNQMDLSMEAVWSMATSTGLWNIFADLDVPVNYGKISLNVLDACPKGGPHLLVAQVR